MQIVFLCSHNFNHMTGSHIKVKKVTEMLLYLCTPHRDLKSKWTD